MSVLTSFEIPNTFGGLEPKNNTLAKSKVVVLPIPLEKSTSYGRGTEYGPQAILNASGNMELYDEEIGCEPSSVGIHTDMSLLNSNFPMMELDNSLDIIEKHIALHIKKNRFIVSLGGEHSITIGIIRAFTKNFKDDFTVVQLDAHADLRDSYENMANSHACVMRRIIDDKKTIQIGIRSLSIEESSLIKTRKLKIFWAGQKFEPKFIERVLKEIKTKNIYITFDLDFLDPSIMPSVGTPEPGGYDFYQTIYLLSELIRKKNLIGIDFNELAPIRGLRHPEFLASKLIYKAIAYKFFGKKRK